VVIGIFVVVVELYWLVYGHMFEGPVSPVLPSFPELSLTEQKFDVIMGERGDGSLNKIVSEPPFAVVEAKSSNKEVV
jgi:hypothetical protein